MNILKLGFLKSKPKPEKQYTVECKGCYTTIIFRASEARHTIRDFWERQIFDGGDRLEVDCPLCHETSQVLP